jgi:hypothetical protein
MVASLWASRFDHLTLVAWLSVGSSDAEHMHYYFLVESNNTAALSKRRRGALTRSTHHQAFFANFFFIFLNAYFMHGTPTVGAL